MTTTFADIKNKVRRVTARPSANQLTETELEDYINNFLIYEMPQHTRLFALRTNYNITLAPNVGVYSILPDDINLFSTFETPAYVDGYEVQYFQDEQAFYQKFSQQILKTSLQLAVGNGAVGPYSGTYSNTPVQPNSVIISTTNAAGASLTCSDDGTGSFTGDVVAGATIDYETGAVANLTWTAAIPNGDIIYMSALSYESARPIAVLYFQNTFTFWPWPDRAYDFQIVAYQNPAQLLTDSQVPELNQWWEFIAYGASLKIFADNLDMDSYAKVRILFDEQRRLVERRTMKQLSTQRVSTIYGDANGYPWQNSYPYN